MHTPHYRSFPLIATVLAVTALMAGCAQQRSAGYYDPPRESSVTDAESQAQGAGYLPIVVAPSQLQIGLNSPKSAQPSRKAAPAEAGSAAEAAQANADAATAQAVPAIPTAAQSLVPQAQTYLGTVPCMTPSSQCVAQKLVLTLAPNGRWRSRSAPIDSTGKEGAPSVTQGCWAASSERPVRIWLSDAAGNQVADFSVAANNVLRVRSALGVTPSLNYNLTRQPDLDPMSELDQQAAPNCSR